jgi:hypothetical protein
VLERWADVQELVKVTRLGLYVDFVGGDLTLHVWMLSIVYTCGRFHAAMFDDGRL